MTPTATTPKMQRNPSATTSVVKSSSVPTPDETSSLSAELGRKKAPEAPIFLKKTYHMIDSCQPDVASWSDDGETFVVKKTDVFEKEIIPQFFKHSKFSSFVRQLNFYGFRKIKFSDTIRIDHKLEAETANFWRFRHDKFQRGKPELLVEIKRASGQNHPTAATNVAPAKKPDDVSSLKSEVTALKERISTMSKNIDDLTSLVQDMKVTEEKIAKKEPEPVVKQMSNKRKKVEEVKEAKVEDVPMKEVVSLKTAVVDDAIPSPQAILPTPRTSRQQSVASNVSDDAFVDELFTAFANDDIYDGLDEMSSSSDSTPTQPATPLEAKSSGNAPDPELMKKLSDALTVLPREMQEMLVNRLITTITSTESIRNHIDAANALSSATPSANQVEREAVPVSPVVEDHQRPEIALPLAAAALAALLSQYGSDSKSKTYSMAKSIPVIPVHA